MFCLIYIKVLSYFRTGFCGYHLWLFFSVYIKKNFLIILCQPLTFLTKHFYSDRLFHLFIRKRGSVNISLFLNIDFFFLLTTVSMTESLWLSRTSQDSTYLYHSYLVLHSYSTSKSLTTHLYHRGVRVSFPVFIYIQSSFQ